MIQTSMLPEGLPDGLLLLAALSLSSPPPHATRPAHTASSAPTAMNLLFIDPPRKPPPLDECWRVAWVG
jgi:hypothetical protein